MSSASAFAIALRNSGLAHIRTADVIVVELSGGDRMLVRPRGEGLVLELDAYGADDYVEVATVSARFPEAAVAILRGFSA